MVKGSRLIFMNKQHYLCHKLCPNSRTEFGSSRPSTFGMQMCSLNTLDILHLPYCQSISFNSLCFSTKILFKTETNCKIFGKKAAYLIFQLSHVLSPPLITS